ncbi:MAG: hypothetical protein JWR60_4198 [Polaromonas sp.]|nr:hypothetical protein [Polaromonas sp.]
MKKYTMGLPAGRRLLAMGGFALAMQAGMAQAQPTELDKAVQAQPGARVQAPPRPPGFEKVVVEAGVNPEEVKRQKRAHNHTRLSKKDHTRNDLLDVLPEPKKPKEPKDPKPPKSR